MFTLGRTRDFPRNTQLGFTLVEILVAISIIGVIFGVVISSSSAIQKNARNAQRKTDLREIQSALQQYYADQQFYPETMDLGTGVQINNATGNPGVTAVSKIYLNKTRIDPNAGTTTPYCYKAFRSPVKSAGSFLMCSETNKCQYYLLCSALESSSETNPDCAAECASGYNFGVSPL